MATQGLDMEQMVAIFDRLTPAEMITARGLHSDMSAEIAAWIYVQGLDTDRKYRITRGQEALIFEKKDDSIDQDTIKENFALLQVQCKVYHDKPPSKYWCAAVLMNIDTLLSKLAYPGGSAHKMKVTIEKGAVVKHNIQHARSLARNTLVSRCPYLQQLKEIFTWPTRSPALALPPPSPTLALPPPSPTLALPPPSPTLALPPPCAGTLVLPPPSSNSEGTLALPPPPSSSSSSATSTPMSSGSSSADEQGATMTPPARRPAQAAPSLAPAAFVGEVSEAEQAAAESADKAKRRRTWHLLRRPAHTDLGEVVEITQPVATPPLQAQAAAEHNEAAKTKAWSLDCLAIPDPERTVPENFDQKVHAAYMRLPEICIPRAGTKFRGRLSYSISDATKATIQVQLDNKAFWLVKKQGGTNWDRDSDGSASVAWSSSATIQEAWEIATAKLGGWEPKASTE